MTEIEKIDEAIEYIAEVLRYGSAPDVKCARHLETALTALREKRDNIIALKEWLDDEDEDRNAAEILARIEADEKRKCEPLALGVWKKADRLWLEYPIGQKGYDGNQAARYVLVKARYDESMIMDSTHYRFLGLNREYYLDSEDYGKTWLAYAHRPGGVGRWV